MIGSLAGVIAEKEPPRLLVESHGVGYEVDVPMSTYLTLQPAEDKRAFLDRARQAVMALRTVQT